jgi:RimJ/RimL family protein N-acetyltransferase
MIPKLATIEEIKEVYGVFAQYEDVFPHIRFDYIQRKIETGRCVYEDDVVITFTVYKRKQRIGDNNHALKGEVMIHQIVNANPNNGKSAEVLQRFFEYAVEGKTVWLTVRSDNERAIKFYGKVGFKDVGNIYWMKGKLPGKVFRYLPKVNSVL